MTNPIDDFVCFDLETTGFGKCAEIIEIGAVKVRHNKIVDYFSELVKPTTQISEKITEITGIRQCDVEDCRSISEVLPDFLCFISDDILVGHNIASFDIHVLRKAINNILGSQFEPMYIDTLLISREISTLDNHKLQTMLDYYGIKNERAHRALQDCKANVELYNALLADGHKADIRQAVADVTKVDKHKELIEYETSRDCPVSLCGKKIVLTGDFALGSRSEISGILVQCGAIIRNSISSKTDYLIVGSLGSDKWKYENGGGKIQQAKKFGIDIITEEAITKLLIKQEVHND